MRLVHLGLGNFSRAHQAWYTHRALDAAHWGIAGFTGRSPTLADKLRPQDGLYTLVTKGPTGDQHEVIASMSAVYAAADGNAWLNHMRSSDVAVLTCTVTEAGYCRDASGDIDLNRSDVALDLAGLRKQATAQVRTAPGRMVSGLAARRAAGAGPLAIVPCDNLPDNGAALQRVLLGLASVVDAGLTRWIETNVSFVTTMVDRIAPEVTAADRQAAAEATGMADAAPVVTEPYSEWVLSGDFPTGRPSWHDVGARFAADVAVFERRKLWLLNGGHSLLAYAGGLRGHLTVAEAIADPVCRVWTEQWWNEAARHVGLPADVIAAYRMDLLERFANPGIRHLLAQIAADGTQKLPVRIVPVLRAERAEGRMPIGAIRALAGWLLHLRGCGVPRHDVAEASLVELTTLGIESAAARVVALVAPDLAADAATRSAVASEARRLGS